jgi:hypothetical protein
MLQRTGPRNALMNRKQRRAAARLGQTVGSPSGLSLAAAVPTSAAELFTAGVKHHQAGRSPDAAACYRSVLASASGNNVLYARAVEEGYRTMWERYCGASQPSRDAPS